MPKGETYTLRKIRDSLLMWMGSLNTPFLPFYFFILPPPWEMRSLHQKVGEWEFMCLHILSRWSKVVKFVNSKVVINYWVLMMTTPDIQRYLVKFLSLEDNLSSRGCPRCYIKLSFWRLNHLFEINIWYPTMFKWRLIFLLWFNISTLW